MTFTTEPDEGFTLLEMLIAFLILSTALVVANQSVSSAVKAFSRTRDVAVADRLASQVLVEHLDERGEMAGEPSGRSAEGYAWRISRTTVPVERGKRQALRASVSVLDPRGKLVRTYVTYFPDPNGEQLDGDR